MNNNTSSDQNFALKSLLNVYYTDAILQLPYWQASDTFFDYSNGIWITLTSE